MSSSFIGTAFEDGRARDERLGSRARFAAGRPALYLLANLILAALYYGAGRLGLELAYLDGAVAALWPPVAVGIAALVLYGFGLWPGVVVGDLLLADFSQPAGTILAQTVGNTLAIVVAASVLRRVLGGRPALERVVDVLAFVGCAVLAAGVSALFGPPALRLGDVIAPDQLAEVFRTWTLSDLSGALVLTPVLLTWASCGLRGFRRRDALEGGALLVLLVALAEIPSQRDVPYIVFPVLLWAALRFGPRGAATAMLVACSLAVWNTANNDGPFVRDSITDSLLATQLFIAVAALTSLLLAAVTAERARAGEALRANEERLRSVVQAMAEGLIVRDGRGVITEANAAAEEITGLTRAELHGRRPEEAIGPALDAGDLAVPADRVLGGPTLRTGEPEAGLVVRLDRSAGVPAWISVSSGAVRDEAGRPIGVVSTLTDITKQRSLAAEQEALRRIATLVAAEPAPARVFEQVTEEVCRLLHVPAATVVRYDPKHATATVVGAWSRPGTRRFSVGVAVPLEGETVTARVHRSGEPQRVETYEGATGELADQLRDLGYRSAVAAPVTVGGRLWGALIATTTVEEPLPAGTERRLCDFADLVAQALANADARDKLAASRARIVEAGDAERRRLERNLHDGAQQRLVALAIQLRLVRARMEADPAAARTLLDGVSADLAQALDELRELARGIHPAILTDRGLGPALEALASRAPVAVDIAELPDERLPHPVEAAAYYVVAEAVTNAAKYADASSVAVRIARTNGRAVVEVADDGVGGADPQRGSGLRGLVDRVEALDGRLSIDSPARRGTRIRAEMPVG
jgi:PAS domain S-box-containing protein